MGIIDDWDLSSGAGELNVGRGIGISRDLFTGGPLSHFQHLEASSSMDT